VPVVVRPNATLDEVPGQLCVNENVGQIGQALVGPVRVGRSQVAGAPGSRGRSRFAQDELKPTDTPQGRAPRELRAERFPLRPGATRESVAPLLGSS
jgi:hypothetical protein